ncbi:MAG: nucleotide exchange factor GrpE [Methylobacter sp.]|jgi:molecular chaperone GrpE|nr:nucleotide exchange factor GrpE [Methylobacter sp.]
MSTDQEAPGSQVKTENETVNEQSHTELAEHELTIEELKQALAQVEQKAQENWDKAVRAQAEMENLKRRTQKDLEDAHKFALTGFAKELLPVLDSLVLGLQAATGDSEEVNKFRLGSELTIKQFESVFTKFKIETIDPIGQPFNAELHQAMAMQAVDGAEPNTVVNVFQKGYTLNGRLLRPAMVLVAKAAEKKPADIPSIDEQA